jgi:hypothetical protein
MVDEKILDTTLGEISEKEFSAPINHGTINVNGKKNQIGSDMPLYVPIILLLLTFVSIIKFRQSAGRYFVIR